MHSPHCPYVPPVLSPSDGHDIIGVVQRRPLQLPVGQLVEQSAEDPPSHLADVVHPDVELVALLDEGVQPAPGLVVLLQDEDLLAGLGQQGGRAQTPGPGADDDDVNLGRDL